MVLQLYWRTGMYDDLQGIIGNDLPSVKTLELLREQDHDHSSKQSGGDLFILDTSGYRSLFAQPQPAEAAGKE